MDHGSKFQSVMTPTSLIAYLSGPYEGKHHGACIFRESNLAHDLSRHVNFPNGEPCSLYGDAAYPINQHLLGCFKSIDLTGQELEFNQQMFSARQCVE